MWRTTTKKPKFFLLKRSLGLLFSFGLATFSPQKSRLIFWKLKNRISELGEHRTGKKRKKERQDFPYPKQSGLMKIYILNYIFFSFLLPLSVESWPSGTYLASGKKGYSKRTY